MDQYLGIVYAITGDIYSAKKKFDEAIAKFQEIKESTKYAESVIARTWLDSINNEDNHDKKKG